MSAPRCLLAAASVTAAACVLFGTAISVAGPSEGLQLPRLDRKPRLQSIAIDPHKGPDRLVVVVTTTTR